ncbi:pancreatic progenitor cell differentiation and proliferation factor-like protein isoform X2 [Oryctolagus cuniculus]|uniref:pancreatic progenitor cell differentiation and proliferation factor-like protein isoform X2 n=1 Tax=Oryctolagus cuniculus TaxID=9986 RepID=UPI00387A82C7
MASVPSIGCLLAKNQYYRKSSISSDSSLTGSDSVNFMDDDKFQQGFPEVAESTWWFKSFFHPGPVLSNVRSKDPSTALIVDAGNQDVLPAEVPRGKPSISSTAANAEDFFLWDINSHPRIIKGLVNQRSSWNSEPRGKDHLTLRMMRT